MALRLILGFDYGTKSLTGIVEMEESHIEVSALER